MSAQLITGLIYCVAVLVWLAVLGIVLFEYIRNPRIFGTTRLLLLVVAIDTCRNLVENIYFGLFLAGSMGTSPPRWRKVLATPRTSYIPKVLNIVAGGVVLGLLLLRWLPQAVTDRRLSDLLAVDLGMLATTDGLTALSNRRHFEELARAEWTRFQRYGRPLSLLLLDIDNFKSINDRFGHDAGDEFVLLLPETDEAAAEIAAERLRKAIQVNTRALPGENLEVTVSIGVAGASLAMSGFEVLLKRADEALYEAKRTGRNRVVRAPKQVMETIHLAAE